MPLSLPEGWTVVPDSEYALLCLLPTFSKRGEDVLYRNECGIDYFVWRQSAYDRMHDLTRQVDSECEAVTEKDIPPIEIAVPLPQIPESNIPEIDKQIWKQAHPDVVPVVGENNRPRDGGTNLGTSGIGGLSGMGGRIDIGKIFDR
jgi:hypothetical protein